MKKMQCEVCGSTDIKKVDDTTFECQSCGVQYSKDEAKKLLVEISGEVKINHSAEVENAIKRAEQFVNDGNNEKAKEYLNKALDMDAENEKAQQRIKEITDNQIFEEYYIVDSKIDPKDNVEKFLRQLATTENIACDIYKEIEIKSVTEKYHTFLFMKNKCECVWSAIACHKYYENETVYETVYRNGRSYKEPTTKKVEKIERVPRNGTYIYDSEGLGFASNEIHKGINLSDKTFENAILEDFEMLQDNKYDSYKPRKIDTRKVTSKNGTNYYNGYELDLTIVDSVYTKKRDEILEKGDDRAYSHITTQIGGDFYENLQATRHVLSHTVAYICIPIQVIKYTYKGKDYVAVSDLVSQITSISKLYPCDVVMAEKRDDLNRENVKLHKMSALAILGSIFLTIGAIIWIISSFTESDAIFVGVGLAAASLIFFVPDSIIKNAKKNKLNDAVLESNIGFFKPRRIYLSKSYKTFFDNYSDGVVLNDIQNHIESFTDELNIQTRLSIAGSLTEFSATNEERAIEEIEAFQANKEKVESIKRKRSKAKILMLSALPLIVIGFIFGVSGSDIWWMSLVLIYLALILFIIGCVIMSKTGKQLQPLEAEIENQNNKWIND